MDGLSRDDRLRYDTPNFYGVVASASTISGSGNDIALNYGAQLGSIKVAAALAYADPISTSSVENQLNGSISALHATGLNVTFAAGSRDLKATGRNDATFFYGKLGYKRQFFSTGVSAFAIDYGRFEELKANDDEADTFGITAVQDFAKWGTEYYLGYRHHDLDRTNKDFKPIDAVLTGFRVKF
ncbi:porin [Thermodesulfobacteriota bacterium]